MRRNILKQEMHTNHWRTPTGKSGNGNRRVGAKEVSHVNACLTPLELRLYRIWLNADPRERVKWGFWDGKYRRNYKAASEAVTKLRYCGLIPPAEREHEREPPIPDGFSDHVDNEAARIKQENLASTQQPRKPQSDYLPDQLREFGKQWVKEELHATFSAWTWSRASVQQSPKWMRKKRA